MFERLEKSMHWLTYWYVRGWEVLGVWKNVNEMGNNLHLSSLPMRGNEKNLIKTVHATETHSLLVVSVVEDYENTQSLFGMDPIRPEEWEKICNVNGNEVKIEHVQIRMKDFNNGEDLNIASAVEAVIKIQEYREKHGSVLVHCKAGRTRSAMLVACVLAIYDVGMREENVSKSPAQLIDITIKLMQKDRPQVKVNKKGQETAVKIVNMVKCLLRGEAKLDEPLKTKVDRSAIDKNVKDTVMELDSYKRLLEYKSHAIDKTGTIFSKLKPVMRVGHIDKFSKSLAEKNDAEWLRDLLCETGSIKDFLDAKPYAYVVKNGDTTKDEQERKEIIESLKTEVEQFFCMNLKCSSEELETLVKSKQPQP